MSSMKPVAFAQSNIMVVDDNPANLKLLEDILTQKGHEVHSFPLGRLALAAAIRNPPDLILLDINMPEMNGYVVCERLKSIDALSDVPVIFLSALKETPDKVKAFRSGAADYISKPFQFEEVHARVETHLNLYAFQRALKLQNERLEESAADVIFRFELYPQPRFSYVNRAATWILGYSPEEYYADRDLLLSRVQPADSLLVEAVFRGDFITGSALVFRCLHRNGNTISIDQRNTLVKDCQGRPIAIEGIARDITERSNLEEQLRQSQKMEAVGLLAGGVAHDFNNLLTVIIGYSDLILSDDVPSAQIVEKLDQIKKAAEHSAVLTRQLLSFGRGQIVRSSMMNINTVVEASSKMFRRTIGENIELFTTLDAGLGYIRAGVGQIEQILMNLVVNAMGAMPQGGRITIETLNVTLDETRAAGTMAAKSGSYVMLAVSDTGCGMDLTTQARIFEPFYTTKEIGKGTGLGLSVVYGIVSQNGGDIRVLSKPGQGARFEILLPRTDEPEEFAKLPIVPSVTRTGSETILLVEDDEAVRELIGTVLQNGGYEVLIARNGNEALRICEQNNGRIGLILTDMVMPGMSGRALVESIRNLNRGMRVLCMSGYVSEPIARDGRLDPETSFIQKPFTPADLIVKIGEILDDGVAGNQ
jgi:PAS domain S-box-containing protein